MTRSSTSSFLLVLLASLSIVSALATPHGDLPHTSHWPNKDYSYEHPRKRQDLTVPTILGSCVLVGGLAVGDQVLVAGDIRYSQLCLQQLAFSLVPEERAVCRRECPTCPFVRGYDIPCITTQVVRRAAQVDLAQLRDTDQQASLLAPTTAADCAVPLEEALHTLTASNWTPFTIVGTQIFNNDCLTRRYLHSLSATASCLPDDNLCMIDSALEDAVEGIATSGLSTVKLLSARRLVDRNY